MRIWDIDTGFLNDKSLLGEHRELHGIVSIIQNNKKGYSKHPETLRWVKHLNSLCVRHDMLVKEMELRGFNHKSPVQMASNKIIWPTIYIDSPKKQYELLKEKYIIKEKGRIPLPNNCQELWSFHKYSVMARNPELYKQIGSMVSMNNISFENLALLLVSELRKVPDKKRMINAIDHMWGYISKYSILDHNQSDWETLLQDIQVKTFEHNIEYLIKSTALGELKLWHQKKMKS